MQSSRHSLVRDQCKYLLDAPGHDEQRINITIHHSMTGNTISLAHILKGELEIVFDSFGLRSSLILNTREYCQGYLSPFSGLTFNSQTNSL